MIKKYFIASFISVSIILTFFSVTALPGQAQISKMNDLLKNAAGAKGAGFSTTGNVNAETAAQRLGSIISVFLGFIGAIATLFIIYGGFVWITAGGNQDKVQKAQKYIINAVLGLIISSLAYIITAVVINIASK